MWWWGCSVKMPAPCWEDTIEKYWLGSSTRCVREKRIQSPSVWACSILVCVHMDVLKSKNLTSERDDFHPLLLWDLLSQFVEMVSGGDLNFLRANKDQEFFILPFHSYFKWFWRADISQPYRKWRDEAVCSRSVECKPEYVCFQGPWSLCCLCGLCVASAPVDLGKGKPNLGLFR